MEDLKIIGYYICETVNTPKWLSGIGNRMLSVSGCLGEIHPKWESFLGGWLRGEAEEYQEKLDGGQYMDFQKDVNRFFDSGRIDVDGRFFSLSDAQYFYEKYFSNVLCQIVSISTADAYFQILKNELENSQSNGTLNGERDRNPLLGNDILGWDMAGFHSFLCNSLHKNLPLAVFNHVGLLENHFDEVVEFARYIEGQGEPVEWIPCRIGTCE